MTDFLRELLEGGKAVVAREVKVGGKVGQVHFRRITAGERQALLRGHKVSRTGGATSFELDLALNEEQQQRLVQFSVCKPDGTPYFKDVAAVSAADNATVKALYRVAAEVNGEQEGDDEPGKD